MRITIDRAGRILVPKRLRDRFNLVAGTELEIETSGDGLRLRKVVSEPTLIRKKGFLVHHGTTRAPIDVAAFIRAEREARRLRRTTPTSVDARTHFDRFQVPGIAVREP